MLDRIIRRYAGAIPEKTAISGKKKLTWKEFDREIKKTAKVLHNAKVSGRCKIDMHDPADMLTALFAVLRAGASPVFGDAPADFTMSSLDNVRETGVKTADGTPAVIFAVGGAEKSLTEQEILQLGETLLYFPMFEVPPPVASYAKFRMNEFYRRISSFFEIEIEEIAGVLASPVYADKPLVIKFPYGSITMACKDKRVMVFRGEPEQYNLYISWNGTLVDFMSKILVYMLSPKKRYKLCLLAPLFSKKLGYGESGEFRKFAAELGKKKVTGEKNVFCSLSLRDPSSQVLLLSLWLFSGKGLVLPEAAESEMGTVTQMLVDSATLEKMPERKQEKVTLVLSPDSISSKLKPGLMTKFPNALVFDGFNADRLLALSSKIKKQ